MDFLIKKKIKQEEKGFSFLSDSAPYPPSMCLPPAVQVQDM